MVYRPSNAGATWRHAALGPLARSGACLTSAGTGSAVGDNGVIVRTTDGGNSGLSGHPVCGDHYTAFRSRWQQRSHCRRNLSQRGKRHWDCAQDNIWCLMWTKPSIVSGNPLRGASFAGPAIGVMVGDGGRVVRMTDGGNAGHRATSGTTSGRYAVSMAGDGPGSPSGTGESSSAQLTAARRGRAGADGAVRGSGRVIPAWTTGTAVGESGT